MKTKHVLIGLFYLATLAFSCWIGLQCNPKQPAPVDSKIQIDTLWQHDTVPSIQYVPKFFTKVDTFWKSQKIDTNAILQAFFNKNYSSDTLVNDSALLVVVNDTVCQNQIQSRVPFIVRNYPIITKTETVYATKDKWFVGGYAGKSMGAEVTYLRQKNLFGLGAGTNGVYVKYSRQIK